MTALVSPALVSPALEIESHVLRNTPDLALLRAAAEHLEPDVRFEPHAKPDAIALADADCRAAYRRVGAHVAQLLTRWLSWNDVDLSGDERAYVARCAREQVSPEGLGLLRALVKLHTAGHEPRDPFERWLET